MQLNKIFTRNFFGTLGLLVEDLRLYSTSHRSALKGWPSRLNTTKNTILKTTLREEPREEKLTDTLLRAEPSFVFLRQEEKRRFKPLRSPQPKLLDWSSLFSLVKLVFNECEHPFIDKPKVIIQPAVADTQLLGLGSKLYPSNMPRMLNKDPIGFMFTGKKCWRMLCKNMTRDRFHWLQGENAREMLLRWKKRWQLFLAVTALQFLATVRGQKLFWPKLWRECIL